jgi:hypothetical protein
MKIERSKTIIYLGIILAVQIVIYLIFNVFSLKNLKLNSIEKQLIGGLKKENIISLQIKDSVNSFNIEKNNDKWIVKTDDKKLPADMTKIDSFLDLLVKLQSGIIVYNGSDTSADKTFGFNDKSSQTLIVKTKDNKTNSIILGNSGSKSSSSYLKFNNEKKIREVNSLIASQTSNTPGLWAVKNIFSDIKIDDLSACEIISNFGWYKGKYKILSNGLKDKEMKFTIDPPLKGVLEDLALENVIYSILNLNISEYKLKGNIVDANVMGNILLTLKSNEKVNIDVFKAEKEDPGNYIIKSSKSDFLYLISEDQAKLMFKDTKDMIKKETAE